MALDLSATITDLRTSYAAACTELKADGIWEAEHLSMIPWTQVTAPWGVIVCSSFVAADWGLGNEAFEFDASLWYLANVTGASSGLRTKLEQILSAFPSGSYLTTSGTKVLVVSRWDYADDLLPNQILRASNHPQRAGVVTLRCLVGESL